jgi:hypothetical protein
MTLNQLEELIEDYAPLEREGYNYQKNYDIISCEWWLPLDFPEREIDEIIDDMEDEVGTRIVYRIRETRGDTMVLTFDVSLPAY